MKHSRSYRLYIHRAVILFLIVAIAVFVFRSPLAKGMVQLGNQFFGGNLPYSTTLADVSYQAALSLDADVPDAWHQRARIAFLQGRFSVALEDINKQLQIHGDQLMAAYYIRGLIYGYKKDYVRAEEDFTTYITWNSGNWAANNDLAWVYFVQGKFAESKKQTEKGLVAFPNNPWLLMMHAMSLYNLGDTKTAAAELLAAKSAAAALREEDWDKAYPGNDPAIAGQGLDEFQKTIDKNLELVHNGAL